MREGFFGQSHRRRGHRHRVGADAGVGVRGHRDVAGLGVWKVGGRGAERVPHLEIAVVAFEAASSALIRAGLEGEERSVVEGAGPGELVRSVVPDYERSRDALKDGMLPVFD